MACNPAILLDTLVKRSDELSDITIRNIHAEVPASYAEANGKYMGRHRFDFFVEGIVRKATQNGLYYYSTTSATTNVLPPT